MVEVYFGREPRLKGEDLKRALGGMREKKADDGPAMVVGVAPLKDIGVLGPFDPVLRAHLEGKVKVER